MSFSPDQVRRFVFLDHAFEPESGTLLLRYRLDERVELTERIVFPPPFRTPNLGYEGALQRCFDLVHWLAGVSYYKTCIPPQIEFAGRAPGPRVAAFLQQVYTSGLAEFAFRNRLRLSERVRFEAGESRPPARVSLYQGAVLPLGGGKDSLVSHDLLRAHHMPFRTIAVGQAPLIASLASRLPNPHLAIGRHLDPQLTALNRAGAYNGHVPISAILAAIMVAGGLLYGYDTIVMSNERSASEANLRLDDGSSVNHQWSKSLEFEDAFARLLDTDILPGMRYFSLLRGWSEIRIAREFATHCDYDQQFSSCNRNFGQGGQGADRRWCGDCPKCRFVALALAPFVTPERLRSIMGAVLLDDPSQIEGYRALAGIGGHKPFECVGETAESTALLCALSQSKAWRDMAVVKALAPRLPDSPPLEAFFTLSDQHRVPREFLPACS